MSTTFAVEVPALHNRGKTIEVDVAYRGLGYMRWENPLAQLLPDDTPVIPINNTAQGIYTIGDIKKKINETK